MSEFSGTEFNLVQARLRRVFADGIPRPFAAFAALRFDGINLCGSRKCCDAGLSPARRLEWYPPFHAMRVRVLELIEDWRRVRLLLPLAAQSESRGRHVRRRHGLSRRPDCRVGVQSGCFPGHRCGRVSCAGLSTREGRTDMELRFVFGAGPGAGDPRPAARARAGDAGV